MKEWSDYFERNRRLRSPIPWGEVIHLRPDLHQPMVASLQRFQIGEEGDGRHLRAGAAMVPDPAYAEAIRLFIAEEQTHARLLKRILLELGERPLTAHWTDQIFVALRHLLGLRLELAVLLSAELIAKRYYRVLLDSVDDPALRAVFHQICRDEEGHIAFHCDFLSQSVATGAKALGKLQRFGWRLFFFGVCAVVAWDHRRVLWAVGVPPLKFWLECQAIFTRAMDCIFEGAVWADPETLSPRAEEIGYLVAIARLLL